MYVQKAYLLVWLITACDSNQIPGADGIVELCQNYADKRTKEVVDQLTAALEIHGDTTEGRIIAVITTDCQWRYDSMKTWCQWSRDSIRDMFLTTVKWLVGAFQACGSGVISGDLEDVGIAVPWDAE